jgi:hypothetical protein
MAAYGELSMAAVNLDALAATLQSEGARNSSNRGMTC